MPCNSTSVTKQKVRVSLCLRIDRKGCSKFRSKLGLQGNMRQLAHQAWFVASNLELDGLSKRVVHKLRCAQEPELTYVKHCNSSLRNAHAMQAVLEVQSGAEQIAESYNHTQLDSREQYDAMYKRSIEDPEGFWSDMAKQFYWKKQVCMAKCITHDHNAG